jgi:hypothetical protein
MRSTFFIILLIASLTAGAAAQALPAASGPGLSDSGSTDVSTSLPAPITGQGGSLEYTSELARSNYIQGGLGFTTAYDDNILNTPDGGLSDVSYSILPHFGLDQSRGHLKWNLDYFGGITLNQRLTSHNQGSHSADLKIAYRFSPHVTLRLNDHLNDTTSFFTSESDFFSTPIGGVLQSPNGSVVTPLSRNFGNYSDGELDYQVGAGTIVGGGGGYYFNRFSDVTDGTGNSSALLNTKSEFAQGFITQRITPRNWSGLKYRFQRLSFNSGRDETLIHSVLYYHTIYLQPTMTLSLFAGPEYTDVSSEALTQVIQLPLILVISTPINNTSWSASGGATFSWQGSRTSMEASFVRRVNDGGGMLGAVRMNSFDATVRRQLTRSSDLMVGAIYGTNDSIDFVATPGTSLRTASGRIGYEYVLRNHLRLGFGYARENQLESLPGSSSGDINHNRGYVSLSYDFSRPIGR